MPSSLFAPASADPGTGVQQVGGGLLSSSQTVPSSANLLDAPSTGGGSVGGGASTTGGPAGSSGAGTPSFTNTTDTLATQAQADSFLKGGNVPSSGGSTGGTGSTGSFSKFIANPSVGSFGDVLTSNAGALAGAGILGFEALNQPNVPGANAAAGALNMQAGSLAAQGGALTAANAPGVASTAANLTSQGTTLANSAESGTLPPGIEQQLQQAGASAKATIRSQYASRGMSGSSAEMQDLANVDNSIAAQRGTLAQQLLATAVQEQQTGAQLANTLVQTGVNETQLSSQLYQQILQQSLQSDQALSNSLGSFAAALAGGGGTKVA
jgi:hypothetical protein